VFAEWRSKEKTEDRRQKTEHEMNAGLTNLDTLKRHLLAATMAGEARFDLQIATLGLGVAGAFDRFCNRRFGYLAGDEIIFTGNREHYSLPRYPLVSVTGVTARIDDDEEWATLEGEPISTDSASGMVRFSGTLGDPDYRVKVIWTGGYYFETLEPEDSGYDAAAPTGATELPGELKAAFLLQCQAVWQQMDKLGAGLSDKPGQVSTLNSLELLPLVKQILQAHIRYQLS
jgi:hypothetical protein